MSIRDNDERLPTGAMIRAARGLVGLDTAELAEAMDVTRKTIFAIERDQGRLDDPRRTRTLINIRKFFVERYGLVFLFEDGHFGEGVRLSAKSELKSRSDD